MNGAIAVQIAEEELRKELDFVRWMEPVRVKMKKKRNVIQFRVISVSFICFSFNTPQTQIIKPFFKLKNLNKIFLTKSLNP